MRLKDWATDGWSWFFGFVAIAIFTTFTAPAVFGFQNFTQWGGMYDDHWCHAEVYSRNPHLGKPFAQDEITVGDMGQSRVYSAPSHNRLTCLVWVRTLCGEKTKDGWTIEWVEPKLQSTLYLHEQNACDLSLPGTEHWYFHAQP